MVTDALAFQAMPSADVVACAHCAQPVPPRERSDGDLPSFCCAGCRSVYRILHECGLDEYYRLRDASGTSGAAASTAERSYAELDEPAFTSAHCRSTPGGGLGTELYLEGVHCAACVWLVEKVSAVLPGVTEARLDVSRGIVRLAWDPSAVRLSAIAAKLDSFGYPCHPASGLDRDAQRKREDRALLMRVGIAGAAAGNAMLLAVALYSGAFDGIEQRFVDLFRWGSVVVALPSVLWAASVFHRGALASIRTLTPHMDLPISLGIVVGSVSGVWNTYRSHGEIYFDSITMLVFLLLSGRFLQQRKQRHAEGVREHLQALAPSTARLVEGSSAREVPVDAVPKGALVEIRSGEHVPVDGVIVEGTSSIDGSLLTGESVPEEVTVGARVHAGCINLSGRLLVRTEEAGQETRLSRLVSSIEEVASQRAPIVLAANRLSAHFVLIVLAGAALTAVCWWHVDPARAVDRAVALLVVTCPCALALATPLAVSAALGRAAKRGILVKGGKFLEGLGKPGLIVFDKTGTLTSGKLSVHELTGDQGTKRLVAAAEAGSAHPVAKALCAALPDAFDCAVGARRETLGGGIEAVVDGKALVVGSPTFVRARTSTEPAWVARRVSLAAESGLTPVLAAVDGEVRAVAALGDPVRPDARRSLESLLRMGHRLAVLSGDQPGVVRAVAARLGVPFEEVVGGATPEAKLAFIRERVARGPVFMVGDGVNDAAALSAATVGIAVHGGAEASLAAADVFAVRGGLAPVVDLFEGSRRTLRVIRGNLARSLVYNLTVGALAASGLVGPLLAAVLMPLSSISVVTSSYRARTFAEDP